MKSRARTPSALYKTIVSSLVVMLSVICIVALVPDRCFADAPLAEHHLRIVNLVDGTRLFQWGQRALEVRMTAHWQYPPALPTFTFQSIATGKIAKIIEETSLGQRRARVFHIPIADAERAAFDAAFSIDKKRTTTADDIASALKQLNLRIDYEKAVWFVSSAITHRMIRFTGRLAQFFFDAYASVLAFSLAMHYLRDHEVIHSEVSLVQSSLTGWSLVAILYLYGLSTGKSAPASGRVLALPQGRLREAISVGIGNGLIAASPTLLCNSMLTLMGLLGR